MEKKVTLKSLVDRIESLEKAVKSLAFADRGGPENKSEFEGIMKRLGVLEDLATSIRALRISGL